MKYYYSNGYLMSEHVVGTLRYLGKVGVLSTSDWNQYFCRNKHRRWQFRQLALLKSNGYIKKHPASSLLGKWILADKGKAFLHQHNWPTVNAVSANHVDHDEFVARSICEMERAAYIHSWKVERELKTLNQKDYMISNIDGDMKFPDAIFKVKLAVGMRTIAIEYERRGKSETRYRTILWNYSNLSSISLVVFICEDDQIERRILRALKNIGNTDLINRFATVSSLDWKSSPLDAPIKLLRGTITFRQVCQKLDEETDKDMATSMTG